MEEPITAGLRLNRQNSAAFEGKKWNPASTARFIFPIVAYSGG
jgi:hypothetical protein